MSHAIEKQDEDFHGWLVRPAVGLHGVAAGTDAEYYTNMDPPRWEDDDFEPLRPGVVAQLRAAVSTALAPWCSHFHSLGLLRGDRLFIDDDDDGEFAEPVFFLVHGTDCVSLSPHALGEFAEARFDLGEIIDGAWLTIRGEVFLVNATLLYDKACAANHEVGQWGGKATLNLAPTPDEGRRDWLARVALSREELARKTERWRRSGGNLELYGHFGSASERAAGDRPIDWLIPGLIPRGYVSLLVGTKQAGKSTLAGEMAAVIDSDCTSARYVLGAEVHARGVSGIVSGEDGDNFMNRRAEFYTAVHGQPLGLVVDTAVRPWGKTLELLWAAPRLDFLVIDPLRAILGGDEDSSGNISRLFDELNSLARAKNCAILLVHHLSKTTPRSLSAMLLAVRGSGAITDRPRMVLGMIDRGHGVTEFGIIKHNIPPGEPLWGDTNVGRLFRRDAATLTLVPVEAPTPLTETGAGDSGQLDLVLVAITHENRLNRVLRKTGKSELFERRVPQLASMSRSASRAAVETLIAAGLVTDGPNGIEVATNTAAVANTVAGVAGAPAASARAE